MKNLVLALGALIGAPAFAGEDVYEGVTVCFSRDVPATIAFTEDNMLVTRDGGGNATIPKSLVYVTWGAADKSVLTQVSATPLIELFGYATLTGWFDCQVVPRE